MTQPFLISRRTLLGTSLALATFPGRARARSYENAPAQPFFANLERILEARQRLGEPLPPAIARHLVQLSGTADAAAVQEAQRLLEPLTLLHLPLGSGGYAYPERGGADLRLVEQGWRSFLVRIINPAGRTDRMSYTLDTPVLGDVEMQSAARPAHEIQGAQTHALMRDTIERARLAIENYDLPPLTPFLSGLPVEYRLVQLIGFSSGRYTAGITAGASSAQTYVWAPPRKLQITALVEPSVNVPLQVLDTDGRGTMASLTIRDGQGRIYPSKHGRLAPDMYFQDQIYRAEGESLRLAEGNYHLEATRGPEYLVQSRTFEVGRRSPPVSVRLKRWVDPAKRGWYSGDVHIHAAGCAHYNDPTVGVSPETMIRHVRGEGLWIGDVLTWGPGYHVQKHYFSGHAVSPAATLEAPDLQAAHGQHLEPRAAATDTQSTIRYDIEISGFPSSLTGHLILLRLKDQFYPGTKGPPDWPSWSLPILRWAKRQGAITGFAHCGFGLADIDEQIPSLVVPSFDSIGANEYLVDVALGAVDFLSGGNTIPGAELTLWYHALNCGFRTTFVGETDWPCVTDDRVGGGRTYVALRDPPKGDDGYDAWVEGLRAGRVYMGDGRAHAFDFRVDTASPGDELQFARPRSLKVSAKVAAWLEPEPPVDLAEVRDRPTWLDPRWHLERARRPGTRSVPVEMIVNGKVVATTDIIADGREHLVRFDLPVTKSCWLALRIYPALHTNPVFISLAGQPVRGPRSSADWCLACLDKLERTQLPRIADSERDGAARAYDEARSIFQKIREEMTA